MRATPTRTHIGITLGDPSGIGPEIVAAAVARVESSLRRRLLVYCDRPILERAFAAVASASLPDDVTIVDRGALSADQALPGTPSEAGARAQVGYLDAAVHSARAGEIAGLVTAPISKVQARRAGFEFAGHTDFLTDRLGAGETAMMFAGPSRRAVLATVHLPLAEVPSALTRARIVTVTRLAVESLRRDFGLSRPRVGVLGLNPHAGEEGMFGREEIEVIAPAVEECRRLFGSGCEVVGPLPPDTAFRTPFDLHVAMYHDQALIPVKLLDFEGSVNVTLGLPIVRTSPDHGVAYDIAGRGQARPESFIAALVLAASILERRAA